MVSKTFCFDRTSIFLKNIKENNPKLNIVLNLYEKESLEVAKNLDNLKIEEKEKLKLFGIVFLIKSIISKKGFIISGASKTLSNYVGTFDSDVVKFIEKEGGIILGTLNCDEFASGSLGKNSGIENKNPINVNSPNRVCGGSSSGSATAISANFCDISLGSDTGGSIRTPASNCGIFGIKPTHDIVSRYGLLDLSMSLDTIGVLTKNLKLANLVMNIMSQKSKFKFKNEGETNQIKIVDFEKPEKNYTIGIIKDLKEKIKDTEIKELFEKTIINLKEEGHKIIEFDFPEIKLGVDAYYPIVFNEFFSATRKYDGLQYGKIIEESCQEEVFRRIYGGHEITKAELEGNYYKKSLKVKQLLKEKFNEIFKKVDFIINPTLPILPPKLTDKISLEEEYFMDLFTIPVNLSEICSGNVPIKTITQREDKVNIGFQVMANKFEEEKMFLGMNLLNNLSKLIK
jgi:aspartyl-tRNA(Asn)/glutamyl-tRNA(Gln) amidotransferase subunit A